MWPPPQGRRYNCWIIFLKACPVSLYLELIRRGGCQIRLLFYCQALDASKANTFSALVVFGLLDWTYIFIPVIVAFKFDLSFRQKLGLGLLPAVTMLPLTAAVVLVIGAFAPRTQQWSLEWAWTASSFYEFFDILLASIIPLMPITKWDSPIIRFFDRGLTKFEGMCKRVLFTRDDTPGMMEHDQEVLQGRHQGRLDHGPYVGCIGIATYSTQGQGAM